MACDLCKKKGIPILCNYCPGNYCSKCIKLDQHNCSGLDLKIKKDSPKIPK